MGLDSNGTKFLLYAKTKGVSFAETAMIGRQTLNLGAAELHKNLRRFNYSQTTGETEQIITSAAGFAEPFLRLLGAETIVSFDASAYENATHVHDFNRPIPEEFKNQYTAVLDGGTLEHVFNFPTAIKNCMEMIVENGYFLSITPTNNLLGHGFYQFSPELYFRILHERNGFAVRQMLIFEDFHDSQWYEVTDPDAVRRRVTLINKRPAYLLVIAEKIKTVEIFETVPQQSDYSVLWQEFDANGKPQQNNAQKNVLTRLKRAARKPFRKLRVLKRQLDQPFNKINQEFFKKIKL